jgi:hypothetical protein
MFRISAIAALAASCGVAAAVPDVICGSLDDMNHYTSGGPINGVRAYAVGTTACNAGDVNLDWIDGSINHPVISGTIYKIKDGRLIQLGATFVKHSFASLQGNSCGFGCGAGGTFQALGPGCSDPYGAGLNGGQTGLGPRSEINAYNGNFAYPFTTINQSGNAIFKRIQVPASEMPDTSARFFVEGQYVIKDEMNPATGLPYIDTNPGSPWAGRPVSWNNVTYERMNVQSNGNASTTGAPNRGRAAIYAWQDHGLGTNQPDNSVEIVEVPVPSEGLLNVACKVTDLGDGTYRYDYAVHNQNSDLNVGSFSVPAAGNISGHFFNDITHHSGPDGLISDLDWAPVEGAGSITWSSEPFIGNPNANAIRWGTMYNFSFVSDAAPVEGEVSVGMWKLPGMVLSADVLVPGGVSCPADLTGDGVLDFFDVSAFLNAFNAQDSIADFTGDGVFDFFDVSAFLNSFNAGCP